MVPFRTGAARKLEEPASSGFCGTLKSLLIRRPAVGPISATLRRSAFHPSALIGLVPTDGTPGNRSQDSVMPSIMTSGAAHSGSLQTSLCICRAHSGEGEHDSSYSHHKFHLGLQSQTS